MKASDKEIFMTLIGKSFISEKSLVHSQPVTVVSIAYMIVKAKETCSHIECLNTTTFMNEHYCINELTCCMLCCVVYCHVPMQKYNITAESDFCYFFLFVYK